MPSKFHFDWFGHSCAESADVSHRIIHVMTIWLIVSANPSPILTVKCRPVVWNMFQCPGFCWSTFASMQFLGDCTAPARWLLTSCWIQWHCSCFVKAGPGSLSHVPLLPRHRVDGMIQPYYKHDWYRFEFCSVNQYVTWASMLYSTGDITLCRLSQNREWSTKVFTRVSFCQIYDTNLKNVLY